MKVSVGLCASGLDTLTKRRNRLDRVFEAGVVSLSEESGGACMIGLNRLVFPIEAERER